MPARVLLVEPQPGAGPQPAWLVRRREPDVDPAGTLDSFVRDEDAERLFATSDEGLIRDARCARRLGRPIWYYRARSEPSPCSRVAYSSILIAVPRRSVHT